MSVQENERIVREIFEAINIRDVERGVPLFSEHCELMDIPFGEVYRGPDGWRQQYDYWLSAFPDGKVEVTDLIATDQRVVVEYRGSGTHTGTLKSSSGEIPPTGRSSTNQFCDIYQIEDGNIVRGRSYFDAASMMRQLGLLPEQAGHA